MSDMANDPWAALDTIEPPDARLPRALDTRQNSERTRQWSPSSILPEPLPQDGYGFKWCRSESRNNPDHQTFQKRLREGWEPVRAEDHPEMMMDLGPKIGVKERTGLVEVGGLILCKMPIEMLLQRRKYYADRTRSVTDAAEDNYMRDSNEFMQKVAENRRKIVFGR